MITRVEAWNWLQKKVFKIIGERNREWEDTWREISLEDLATLVKLKAFRLQKNIKNRRADLAEETIRDLVAYVLFLVQRLDEIR